MDAAIYSEISIISTVSIFCYTVSAVFEVTLQYSPRYNIARKQADILAIEPALQYNPQIYIFFSFSS